MEDIDGGLHPAVDGQSLGEVEGEGPLSEQISSWDTLACCGDVKQVRNQPIEKPQGHLVIITDCIWDSGSYVYA